MPGDWEHENKRAFVLLVQTEMLCRRHPGDASFATRAVWLALRCREQAVPSDLRSAVMHFCDRLRRDAPLPDWYEAPETGNAISGY